MDSISSISFQNEPLISWTQRWTFLGHFCHHFWVGATAKQHQTHPKVMTKMVKKCSTLCSTDQRFIWKINTTCRIHALDADLFFLSFWQKTNFERISLILDCMICCWSTGLTFAEELIKLSRPNFMLLFDRKKNMGFSYIHRYIIFGRIANLFLAHITLYINYKHKEAFRSSPWYKWPTVISRIFWNWPSLQYKMRISAEYVT
jgi:hypothetical protein